MAHNRLILAGLTDTFKNMGPQLAAAAAPIVRQGAERAAAAVASAYPSPGVGTSGRRVYVVTGKLQRSVRVGHAPSANAARIAYKVWTDHPIAHIYEFGSVQQRPHPTFIPITNRERRATTAAVVDMVEAKGFIVRGADR
jgi:hypothetical protein